MKSYILSGIAILMLAISSCTEDTTTMGKSLINIVDKIAVVSDTFNISTRSIIADSILSRSVYSYLGRIKDPETGSYISADYMTQFYILESQSDHLFTYEEDIVSRDEHDNVKADSCFLSIIVNDFKGDSLAAMKMQVTELIKPVPDGRLYYTNFDPEEEGYLRTTPGGINKSKVYSLSDLMVSDSIRNLRNKGNLYHEIKIPLNQPYIDNEGRKYDNYGTYIIQQYTNYSEKFETAQSFIRKVCPGFYFKTTDGLGIMSEIIRTQLQVFYRLKVDTTMRVDLETFNGTEEVLQTTHFSVDKDNIERLAKDQTCTYIKSPDGIFTELTIPVDDIKRGHENDTITSAKIVLRKMNEISDFSDDLLSEPQHLLIIERDSMYTFFEHLNLPNNIDSYLASYNSSKNTYTFNNISSLVNRMYRNRGLSENWNKAVIIPVDIETTASSTTTNVSRVSNELRTMSIRLVGGSQNRHDPVQISVVYNKNE